jgi:hypothetical protein
MKPAHTPCTEACWTPAPCPICGFRLPPRGRDVPAAESLARCCEKAMNEKSNTRHLFDIHDSDRAYFDLPGWMEHEEKCYACLGIEP